MNDLWQQMFNASSDIDQRVRFLQTMGSPHDAIWQMLEIEARLNQLAFYCQLGRDMAQARIRKELGL